ncbi:elongation of very long chain fatty acids protein AAEL008004-like [Pseudomyrmex gracilis]|uniref:elongation of very long chain fatty acids protein AAEL008004-like n=1 Tax=Pseudomyrmex gracilis TaxID=219809 RepID=UPI000994914A|nr:elongation of very long chain fatty acids protein AAEL008004-like [Pseudomyrmex gracilis]
MTELIGKIYDAYRDLMDNKSDPRVNDWLLMSSPFPTLAICLFYAYFSKVLGPKLMENRKPFDCRKVMLWYNLFQVIFSIWLFREAWVSGWGGHYSFKCQPVDYSYNPIAVRMAHGCWWYYVSKFTEFADTTFFVLRKKNDHISTLHVIHHGIMPLSVWFGVKFTPGGHSSFFGFLNTFVHIVMYSYYFLAALGPQLQPYLWWKKYLTTLQMIQFVLVMIHAFQLLFIDCNYPKAFVWIIGLHAVMFYFLFRDFYFEAYKKKNLKKLSDMQTSKDNKCEKHQTEQAAVSDVKESVNEKGAIYANQYRMATGYISDSGLRNRVFIDNRNFK